jgi:hypothetical protein
LRRGAGKMLEAVAELLHHLEVIIFEREKV